MRVELGSDLGTEPGTQEGSPWGVVFILPEQLLWEDVPR